MKLFIKNWARRDLGVDITTVLKPKTNLKIERFPETNFNNMIDDLKRKLR